MSKNLLFFPIKLFSNEWSLFVAVALPCIGKKSFVTPTLCYFDSTGCNNNNGTVITMSDKIRQFLNVLWRNKFSAKVDKIENPFNKRSLPLKCFKGENIVIVLIESFVVIFPNWKNIPDNLKFCVYFNFMIKSREAI